MKGQDNYSNDPQIYIFIFIAIIVCSGHYIKPHRIGHVTEQIEHAQKSVIEAVVILDHTQDYDYWMSKREIIPNVVSGQLHLHIIP